MTGQNEHQSQIEQLAKLTGQLAHEIKNPLSTIKINLKLIREDMEDSKDFQADRAGMEKNRQIFARALNKITVIQKETDRLEQILDSFLRYLDRTEPQLANADVNEIISDMVDFYSPQARSHRITIRQGLYRQPLVCKIDAAMLKQAILNLFINAQQAMSEGGELLIRTDKQKQYAIIQISDTGTGIPPDKLPRIFNAYFSSRPQGSGLGLPIAKNIIQAHKGSINVNSEPGKGTLFTIKLPLFEVPTPA